MTSSVVGASSQSFSLAILQEERKRKAEGDLNPRSGKIAKVEKRSLLEQIPFELLFSWMFKDSPFKTGKPLKLVQKAYLSNQPPPTSLDLLKKRKASDIVRLAATCKTFAKGIHETAREQIRISHALLELGYNFKFSRILRSSTRLEGFFAQTKMNTILQKSLLPKMLREDVIKLVSAHPPSPGLLEELNKLMVRNKSIQMQFIAHLFNAATKREDQKIEKELVRWRTDFIERLTGELSIPQEAECIAWKAVAYVKVCLKNEDKLTKGLESHPKRRFSLFLMRVLESAPIPFPKEFDGGIFLASLFAHYLDLQSYSSYLAMLGRQSAFQLINEVIEEFAITFLSLNIIGNPLEVVNTVYDQIHQLPVTTGLNKFGGKEKGVILVSGYRHNEDGHGVLFWFHRTGNDRFSVQVINTGAGAYIIAKEGERDFRIVDNIFVDLPKETISKEFVATLTKNIGNGPYFKDRNTFQKFVTTAFAAGRVIGGKEYVAQRHGSCSVKPFARFLYERLGSLYSHFNGFITPILIERFKADLGKIDRNLFLQFMGTTDENELRGQLRSWMNLAREVNAKRLSKVKYP